MRAGNTNQDLSSEIGKLYSRAAASEESAAPLLATLH
jgi:hypothetical protein